MAYEAVVFGFGMISAILAVIGLGIKDKEYDEDEIKRLKKHWYYILLDPCMLRLLFVTSSLLMLLIVTSMTSSIAEEEKLDELLILSQGGYNALIFVIILFFALSVLSILANIMEMFTRVGDDDE